MADWYEQLYARCMEMVQTRADDTQGGLIDFINTLQGNPVRLTSIPHITKPIQDENLYNYAHNLLVTGYLRESFENYNIKDCINEYMKIIETFYSITKIYKAINEFKFRDDNDNHIVLFDYFHKQLVYPLNILKQKILDTKRKELKVGSNVEIYSGSFKKWIPGDIIEIFTDNDGEWLKIKYEYDGAQKFKEIGRFNNWIRLKDIEDYELLDCLMVNLFSKLYDENDQRLGGFKCVGKDKWNLIEIGNESDDYGLRTIFRQFGDTNDDKCKDNINIDVDAVKLNEQSFLYQYFIRNVLLNRKYGRYDRNSLGEVFGAEVWDADSPKMANYSRNMENLCELLVSMFEGVNLNEIKMYECNNNANNSQDSCNEYTTFCVFDKEKIFAVWIYRFRLFG